MRSPARKKRLADERRAAAAYQRPVRSRDISGAALLDRQQRKALAPPTLTARIMGDPLPGRSALDRKQREFEISIMVKAKPEATVEQLLIAVTEMLRRSVRLPVDRRFDWAAASVAAEIYRANGAA